MGYYDRDYYRDTPSSWWPSISGRRAVWGLIFVTIGVYVFQVFGAAALGNVRPGPAGGELLLEWGSFKLDQVREGQVWRLLTAHFVHQPNSLLAIAFGMLALYFFGMTLETLYGGSEFLAFYLVTGLIITLTLTICGLLKLPVSPIYFGCQGILTGVLVLFACHFPHERVYIIIFPVPAWLVATLWIALSLFGLLGGQLGPVPHLVAGLAAFIYHRLDFRILGFLGSVGTSRRRTVAPSLQVYRDDLDDDTRTYPRTAAVVREAEPRVEPRPVKPALDEQLEAKLDQILEKVARSGRGSLTAAEHEILQLASAEYKRRRSS